MDEAYSDELLAQLRRRSAFGAFANGTDFYSKSSSTGGTSLDRSETLPSKQLRDEVGSTAPHLFSEYPEYAPSVQALLEAKMSSVEKMSKIAAEILRTDGLPFPHVEASDDLGTEDAYPLYEDAEAALEKLDTAEIGPPAQEELPEEERPNAECTDESTEIDASQESDTPFPELDDLLKDEVESHADELSGSDHDVLENEANQEAHLSDEDSSAVAESPEQQAELDVPEQSIDEDAHVHEGDEEMSTVADMPEKEVEVIDLEHNIDEEAHAPAAGEASTTVAEMLEKEVEADDVEHSTDEEAHIPAANEELSTVVEMPEEEAEADVLDDHLYNEARVQEEDSSPRAEILEKEAELECMSAIPDLDGVPDALHLERSHTLASSDEELSLEEPTPSNENQESLVEVDLELPQTLTAESRSLVVPETTLEPGSIPLQGQVEDLCSITEPESNAHQKSNSEEASVAELESIPEHNSDAKTDAIAEPIFVAEQESDPDQESSLEQDFVTRQKSLLDDEPDLTQDSHLEQEAGSAQGSHPQPVSIPDQDTLTQSGLNLVQESHPGSESDAESGSIAQADWNADIGSPPEQMSNADEFLNVTPQLSEEPESLEEPHLVANPQLGLATEQEMDTQLDSHLVEEPNVEQESFEQAYFDKPDPFAEQGLFAEPDPFAGPESTQELGSVMETVEGQDPTLELHSTEELEATRWQRFSSRAESAPVSPFIQDQDAVSGWETPFYRRSIGDELFGIEERLERVEESSVFSFEDSHSNGTEGLRTPERRPPPIRTSISSRKPVSMRTPSSARSMQSEQPEETPASKRRRRPTPDRRRTIDTPPRPSRPPITPKPWVSRASFAGETISSILKKRESSASLKSPSSAPATSARSPSSASFISYGSALSRAPSSSSFRSTATNTPSKIPSRPSSRASYVSSTGTPQTPQTPSRIPSRTSSRASLGSSTNGLPMHPRTPSSVPIMMHSRNSSSASFTMHARTPSITSLISPTAFSDTPSRATSATSRIPVMTPVKPMVARAASTPLATPVRPRLSLSAKSSRTSAKGEK